jgi:hypothetical protein
LRTIIVEALLLLRPALVVEPHGRHARLCGAPERLLRPRLQGDLLVVVPGKSLVVVRFGPEPIVLPAFRREFMKRGMAAML